MTANSSSYIQLIASIIILFTGISCANKSKSTVSIPQKISQTKSLLEIEDTIIDERDGEEYKVITYGANTWFVQNLRFDAPGSIKNPQTPHHYGRYYPISSLLNLCPEGWHVATDSEWNALEVIHGMPEDEVPNMGWRGKHAVHLKSNIDWEQDTISTNSLDFNVLPAGYYFSEKMENLQGMDTDGYSAAFWTSVENNVAYARFMFSAKEFVNKWDDNNNDSGSALSCRCVKDY